MAEAATLNYSGVTEKIEPQYKTLKREIYTNAINYANFCGEPLNAVFRHKVFGRELTVPGVPSPCTDNLVELSWAGPDKGEPLEQFICSRILIPDHDGFISIEPSDYSLSPEGMTIMLPETAEMINCRRNARYPGDGIEVTLIQSGSCFDGRLVDFNPESMLISLEGSENSELRWINREEDFSVMLRGGGKTLFVGSCSLLATRDSGGGSMHAFRIIKSEIRKYRKKKFRGERYELMSSVVISFIHPLSGDRCRIPLIDISASGFCLMEDEFRSVLLPGLLIPELDLLLPGGTPLRCSTQVIYRQKIEDSGKIVIKCGMAIIDMLPDHHSMLLNFVHQENDSRPSVCSQVGMNALWRFFFESGFLYPEKYSRLSGSKEKIKDLYERLYTKTPGIARHFIYQEGNRILGHMSMLRSYEESWLLHHHAASIFSGRNAGLQVLNQVGSFSNNSYRIKSLHMLYLMCYYREENKFPRRVFGDIARNTDDPGKISLDSMSYFHFDREDNPAAEPPEGWTLTPTTEGDLKNLESFYRGCSDGLMLKAMGIDGRFSNRNIMKEYSDSGFNRRIELSSVKFNGECRAIIMADQSETGINMSNLTDSMKVFIINPDDLDREIIYSFLRKTSEIFTVDDRIPVLMFPEDSADNLNIPIEKKYTLWILNTEDSDSYFRYLKTLLKRISH